MVNTEHLVNTIIVYKESRAKIYTKHTTVFEIGWVKLRRRGNLNLPHSQPSLLFRRSCAKPSTPWDCTMRLLFGRSWTSMARSLWFCHGTRAIVDLLSNMVGVMISALSSTRQTFFSKILLLCLEAMTRTFI